MIFAPNIMVGLEVSFKLKLSGCSKLGWVSETCRAPIWRKSITSHKSMSSSGDHPPFLKSEFKYVYHLQHYYHTHVKTKLEIKAQTEKSNNYKTK